MLFLFLILCCFLVKSECISNTEKYTSESLIAPSFMRQMWMSPIQVWSLIGGSNNAQNYQQIDEQGNPTKPQLQPSFLKDFANSILLEFNEFRSNRTLVQFYKDYLDLAEGALDSDVFFIHQQQTKSESFTSKYCKQVEIYDKTIVNIFYNAIRSYLHQSRVTDETINKLSMKRENLMVWASIHANSSLHNAHHHVKSSVSGVIYLNTPQNSGSIYFEDPRGKLPPFGNIVRIKPEFGDLVLFPGWLIHGVEPTISAEPRISLSFNWDGDWETTSDVNIVYIPK